MKVSIVVAVAQNGVIGKDNDLIWHLPRDLRFFKKVTTGHHILMGSNTYLALGKPLPNRPHIIVSRSQSFTHEQITMATSVEEGVDIALKAGEKELFITGGGQIYNYCLENKLVDKIYLSTVMDSCVDDTYFKPLDKKEWQCISRVFYQADDKNNYGLTFEQLVRS